MATESCCESESRMHGNDNADTSGRLVFSMSDKRPSAPTRHRAEVHGRRGAHQSHHRLEPRWNIVRLRHGSHRRHHECAVRNVLPLCDRSRSHRGLERTMRHVARAPPPRCSASLSSWRAAPRAHGYCLCSSCSSHRSRVPEVRGFGCFFRCLKHETLRWNAPTIFCARGVTARRTAIWAFNCRGVVVCAIKDKENI